MHETHRRGFLGWCLAGAVSLLGLGRVQGSALPVSVSQLWLLPPDCFRIKESRSKAYSTVDGWKFESRYVFERIFIEVTPNQVQNDRALMWRKEALIPRNSVFGGRTFRVRPVLLHMDLIKGEIVCQAEGSEV